MKSTNARLIELYLFVRVIITFFNEKNILTVNKISDKPTNNVSIFASQVRHTANALFACALMLNVHFSLLG